MSPLQTNPTCADTICAISTPPGIGGIAVIRISGPRAVAVADSLWHGRPLAQAQSHTAHLGTLLDDEGLPLDQAVATVYRGPASFTGQDVVEISVHGSRWIQRQLIQALCKNGARLAEPGEFSRRAFLAGKLDLAQTEAVADMIASNSRASHRIAIKQMRGHYSARLNQLRDKLVELASLLELELDFSEEVVEFASRQHLRQLASQLHAELTALAASFRAGQAIRDGIPVAIIGEPNAGKSSLLNALLGDDRAIVSDIPGTTRDIVEDTLELGDYLFRFRDTAGLRHSHDAIETLGIQRSRQAAATARILLIVIDASEPLPARPQWLQAISDPTHTIILLNKSDKHPLTTPAQIHALLTSAPRALKISAKEGGVDDSNGTNSPKVLKISAKIGEGMVDSMGADSLKVLKISAIDGQGIEELKEELVKMADADAGEADAIVTNQRHAQALTDAADAARRVIDGLDANLSGDLIAQDVRQTIHHLSLITGQITTTDLLQTIFTRFCIGK